MIERLLPHAPPMRMLTALHTHDAHGLQCSATFDASWPFADADGVIDPMVCIELVAQAAALWTALQQAHGAGPPRHGVIASCRQARFAPVTLNVGDTVAIHVTRVAGDDTFASFDGTVSHVEIPARSEPAAKRGARVRFCTRANHAEVATISLGVVIDGAPQ